MTTNCDIYMEYKSDKQNRKGIYLSAKNCITREKKQYSMYLFADVKEKIHIIQRLNASKKMG